MTGRLFHYQNERAALLEKIQTRLENDPHVIAAWLWGSLGRGDADPLSDIDLWVVTAEDPLYPQGFDSRRFRQLPAAIDPPLMTLEVPQNAPENGAYLMACYDAPVAPHIVDWYFQLQSSAYIPPNTLLLFDRAGLPEKDEPVSFPGRPASSETGEQPAHFITFFWMMLLITAKRIYRSPRAPGIDLLPILLPPFIKAQKLLKQNRPLRLEEIPTYQSPLDKLNFLRRLAGQMDGMMAALAAQGEAVPHAMFLAALGYLEMVEDGLGGD